MAVSFIGGGNRIAQGKTTDLPQITDKFYHIMFYRIQLVWVGFELTTSVVIGTNCIDSYKSNYYTIMAMPAPLKIKISQICFSDHLY
jgi:hypothetical protein